MTFDIQYVAVLWVVSFQVFFYIREWQPSYIVLSQFPSLKASIPQRDFMSELWLFFFFSLQKQTYTSMQTFSHFFNVHFPRCKKKSCLLASACWRDTKLWGAQNRQREKELLKMQAKPTLIQSLIICVDCVFFLSRVPHEHSGRVRQCACEWQKSARLALGLPLLIWQMDGFFREGGGGQLWQWGT